jgi:hypothetical protein
MSSGEKGLVLTFLFVRMSMEQGGIVLIDEPELHLNATVQANILNFLIEHCVKPLSLQVFLCTHSPEIVRDAYERDDCGLYHLRAGDDLRVGPESFLPGSRREKVLARVHPGDPVTRIQLPSEGRELRGSLTARLDVLNPPHFVHRGSLTQQRAHRARTRRRCRSRGGAYAPQGSRANRPKRPTSLFPGPQAARLNTNPSARHNLRLMLARGPL